MSCTKLQQEFDEYYQTIIKYTKSDYHKLPDTEILKIFFDACCNNWLDIVKNIYQLNRIDIYYNNFYIFKRICEKGFFELARWIYDLNPLKVPITNVDNIFLHCCYSGNLELIGWFYNKNEEWLLRNIECGCNIFNHMIGLKLYDVSKWIYDKFRLDKVEEAHINYDDMFLDVVKNNNIDMVIWFRDLKKINPEKINYYAFEACCIHGNLEMARIVYDISPIDAQIHKNYDKPFRFACENGWLDLAQWIYYVLPGTENDMKNKKNIDITVCNHYAFRKALKNRNMHIVKWLETIIPSYKTSKIRTNSS